MIFLIVNADDLGINPERDRGIIEAFEKGLVTSATTIANGFSFETASATAKEVGLPIGVHLNLSEGVTLSGPIAGLTDQNNRLPGKTSMRQYLLGDRVDRAGIHREFSAQIEKTLAAGLRPGHLDGHQHCHAYPAVTEVVIDVAKEFEINAIRSTWPADPTDATIPEELTEDMALFRDIGCKCQAYCQAAGMNTTQGLWGLPRLNSLDTAALCRLLANMPEGCWELMTHPGYPHPEGLHFESPQRLTELKALCSPEVKTIVDRRKIKLGTYGDLPCAS